MIQQFYPVKEHHYQYELNKDFQFAAAHFLPNELAGKCQNVHGHTYFVNITIVGNELDELGMLVNFSTVKKIIHERFDHGVMNDYLEMPSTELVAKYIYDTIEYHLQEELHEPKIHQVLIRETPTSYVIYRGEF